MVEFNGKISQLVNNIISKENDPKKCDSKAEFKELAALLANTEKQEEQDYIMGFMLERSTTSECSQTTENAEPYTMEKMPAAEQEPPASGIDRSVVESMTIEDWKNSLQNSVGRRRTDHRAYDTTNALDTLYQAEAENIENTLNEAGQKRIKNLKNKIDEILKHDWRTSKDDLDGRFGHYEVAYLVDETIAARIDNVFGLDKKDVFELVVTPLYDRAKALASVLKDYIDTSVIEKYKSASQKMSLEEMQAAINDLAKFVRNADKKYLELHNNRVRQTERINENAANFNDNVDRCINRLSEIAYNIVHDVSKEDVSIEKYADGTTVYIVSNGEEVIKFVVDNEGKVTLAGDSSSVKAFQEAAYDTIQLQLFAIADLIQAQIDSGKVKISALSKIDENGCEIKYCYFYDADGKVASSWEATYDSNGNNTQQVWKDADGKVKCSCEYTYDSNGKITQQVWKDADGKVQYNIEHTYDSNGKITQQVWKDADGKVEKSCEYTYDSNGNNTQQVWKDADGKVEKSCEYTYDSNGNMTQEVDKDADGKVKRSIEYTYDSEGNSQSVYKDAEGNIIDYGTWYDLAQV